MIYLILCILSSTGIFLVFKFLDLKQLPSFPVIVINYLVAAIFGYIVNNEVVQFSDAFSATWFPLSVFIGVLFIVMFFVIARSSAEAGISITTVASKMSVVFPITYSIIIDQGDHLTLLKALAIASALIGVLLTVYQPVKKSGTKSRVLIPLILFVGMGIVDSTVKHAQHFHVGDSEAALFSGVLFFISFLTGIVILPFTKGNIKHFKKGKIWLWGILLGTVNFGSIYFMVSALNHTGKNGLSIDSSVIFGTNNIGIFAQVINPGHGHIRCRQCL